MPDVPEVAESPDRGVDVHRGLARERVRAMLFGGDVAAATIDRFTLIEHLGSGGMGTVYAAYDPRLDRKIALKLLRDDVEVGTDSGRRRQGRLLHEARAMAKLSHPNVGAVHDVGAGATGPDGAPLVWIAMEFIDGEGLGQWCRRARPSAKEILDAYAQVGEGLAAAHAAGLVHRDVKPDNAMRDTSGRVRVLDFGLARPAIADTERAAVDLAELAQLDLESFTQTGAVIGTPAYMAPEQFDGAPADARADQFAFCVALFEALWDVRPHAGKSVAAIADERRRGRIVETARRRDVPAGVRAVLLRGLSTDPATRWPSMGALLRALAGRRANKRGLVIAAATLAVGGAVAIAAWPRASCSGAGDAVGSAWDDGAATRLRTAFATDTRAFVPATTERVIAALDGYTTSLRDAYREACVATHETRVQSTELLDRRTACLDVRRNRLAALVAVLEQPDAEVIERATTATSALEPIAACSDAGVLLATPPPDAAIASAVADAEAALGKAAAARTAGHFAEAKSLATVAHAQARATEYRPLVAKAQLELGHALDLLGDGALALEQATEAHFAGNADGQHELAADAAALAIKALPATSANVGVARLWHRAGTSVAGRMDDGELVRAEIDVALGTYLLRVQDVEGAREPIERGLEVQRRRLGADSAQVQDGDLTYARVLVMSQAVDEARPIIDRVRAQAEAELVDDPTHLATVLGSVGSLYLFSGDLATAEPILVRTLALADANLGRDHPTTNVIRVDLAMLLYRDRRREQAAELLAIATSSAARHPEGDGLARALHLQGIVLKGLNRLDEALASEMRSLAWYREHMPDSPRTFVFAYLTVGNIQLLRDDNPAAEAAYLEALRLVDAHALKGPRILVQSDYANFLFQTGRATESIRVFEDMLTQLRAASSPAYEIAQYEFDLARALWREGKDRTRAHEVATRVLHVLRTQEPTPQTGGHIRRDWTADEVAKWFDDPDAWETN
jgi:tRNA A-37 threonylcarbamoyl transferase component Bud32/tetratricopeptide (TPR) repeat protein